MSETLEYWRQRAKGAEAERDRYRALCQYALRILPKDTPHQNLRRALVVGLRELEGGGDD